jgi:hypothetical protein
MGLLAFAIFLWFYLGGLCAWRRFGPATWALFVTATLIFCPPEGSSVGALVFTNFLLSYARSRAAGVVEPR